MKIGIALGGGGARGFAHVGVLRALLDAGIEPDVVAGTSIGALVGAAYAADRLSELEKTWQTISATDLPSLLSPRWPRDGFFSAQRGMQLVREVVGVDTFSELKRPLATVAVNLLAGERVVFTDGPVIPAIRASISIPVVFSPVVEGETILVDGGVLEPLPVTACRELGADFVIGVNLFGKFRSPAPRSSQLDEKLARLGNSAFAEWVGRLKGTTNTRLGLLDTLSATLSLYQRELTRLQLAVTPADFVFEPQVEDIGVLEFHRARHLRQSAYALVEQRAEQLRALLTERESRHIAPVPHP